MQLSHGPLQYRNF